LLKHLNKTMSRLTEHSDVIIPLLKAEVPNLGYMYPQGYIFLSEGVHLRLAIEEKSIFT